MEQSENREKTAARSVREEAHAKINLSLDVLRKREDGYHEVCMVMQTLALCDEIEIRAEENGDVSLRIEELRGSAEGKDSEIPTDQSNLMCRAAALLREHCKLSQGVSMHLKKRIPVAAGLAGGSSDAAAVLRGMNRLFELGLSDEQLAKLGVTLGADIPYCLSGGTMLAEGIGEQLKKLPAPPKACVLLVKPKRGVSTGAVYGALQISSRPKEAHPDVGAVLTALSSQDYNMLCGKAGNILELVTVPQVPEIGAIMQLLQQGGADCVRMSGSGPTVFALFQDREKMAAAAQTIRTSTLAEQISDVVETDLWFPVKRD